nr:uncharacterized protein LOC124815698 [Hydra vulgaris]
MMAEYCGLFLILLLHFHIVKGYIPGAVASSTGFYIEYGIIGKYESPSVEDCLSKCASAVNCKSFCVSIVLKLCYLNNVIKDDVPSLIYFITPDSFTTTLIKDASFVYYEMILPET